MEPKFTRMPDAILAAIARACEVLSRSSCSSFAAAIAAPKVPMVPEEWNPFM
jgi:hypothetical protein